VLRCRSVDTGLLWSLVKVGGLSRFLLSFSGDCEVTLSANIDARPLNLISSLLWSADDGVDGDREESDVSLKSMVASLLRAIGRIYCCTADREFSKIQ